MKVSFSIALRRVSRAVIMPKKSTWVLQKDLVGFPTRREAARESKSIRRGSVREEGSGEEAQEDRAALIPLSRYHQPDAPREGSSSEIHHPSVD